MKPTKRSKKKIKAWPGRYKKEDCNTGYCRHCKLYGWPGKRTKKKGGDQ